MSDELPVLFEARIERPPALERCTAQGCTLPPVVKAKTYCVWPNGEADTDVMELCPPHFVAYVSTASVIVSGIDA